LNENKVSKLGLIHILLSFSIVILGLIIFTGFASSPIIGFFIIALPLIDLIIEVIRKTREQKHIKEKIDDEISIVAQWSYYR